MSKAGDISGQIDQTYKNLLDGFNPTARQIIHAGKGYLKSLHATSAASNLYLDSISKLSSQVQQNPTGVSADIGSSLEQVVDVYKEIQSQQNNILKAFYVDFIVPLETNLEKDAKLLHTEHKRFLTQQKARHEALAKAEASVRKQRRKKINKNSIDKEIKTFQILDEERNKLETFLDQSYHEVTTSERRRNSFVLEHLCSLGRHHLALHSKGASLLQKHLDAWISTASGDTCSSSSFYRHEEGIYSTPEEGSQVGGGTPLRRRAQSLDGYLSEGERRSPELRQVKERNLKEFSTSRPLAKAKSEYSLEMGSRDMAVPPQPRRSMAVPERRNLARASFSFQATADNQLTFQEGDVINLMGSKNKGWQYGENQRTQRIGWFPVAYTDVLEEVDSAIGNKDSSSSSSIKVSYERTRDSDSSYLPSRGQSLDRLDRRVTKAREIRARSSSTNPSPDVPRPSVRTSGSTLQQVLNEEEKGRTYYSIHPPSSNGDSDNKKTFETFNSHLFLSEDMEEDLESYEGSYREDYSQRTYEQNKYTSFGAEHSLSPSLCRSLTSPELPACFRKSVSSKDSVHCSDDSGFSNEEHIRHARKQPSTSSYTESYSNSQNSSWVTDSYEMCGDCNTSVKGYEAYPDEEKSSPTFLRYLYPSYKNSSTMPIRHSSVDALDNVHESMTKKESWIVNAFGTLGKKKKHLVSPCAQKIATQKARKKNERPSLRRSSSLLCIDMTNCTSSPEEAYTSNYEDITYATWHHVPVINVSTDLPSPPPYDPPPLPKKPAVSLTKRSSLLQQHQSKQQIQDTKTSSASSHNQSNNRAPDSSSGNSSWSESEGSCMEAYMVVKENTRDISPYDQDNQGDRKRYLTRSYTWASPDAKKSSIAGKHKKNSNCNSSSAEQPKSKSKNYPIEPPPKPAKKKNNCYQNANSFSGSIEHRTEEIAPPLPPRKKMQTPPKTKAKPKNVNIFNYSDYMCQRLTNPDGTCRFDQRSFTTGQKCSAWYDLWGDDPSVGKIV